MEGTEEVASLTVEVGVRYQSSSTEIVLDDDNDDVVLDVSCSQSQSQVLDDENDDVAVLEVCSQSQSQLLVVLREEAVVVSSDGVDSRLAV